MKSAICVGINKYPNPANWLYGCVNDAIDWATLFRKLQFENIKILLDSKATKANIKEWVLSSLLESSTGDIVVIQYSGHGTQSVDMSGDELDGYDEALFVYDGIFLDDDWREILKQTPPGVQVVFIMDSCFSDTVTRKLRVAEVDRIRFVQTLRPDQRGLPRRRKLLTEEEMPEILFSGCGDNEYSYDAYIDGRANGAFTRTALNAFKEQFTNQQWYDEIRKMLPSKQYPQTPMLNASILNRNCTVFDLPGGIPGPDPDPTPQPEPDNSNVPWETIVAVVLVVAAAVAIVIKWGC
jgi:hypothetical protein